MAISPPISLLPPDGGAGATRPETPAERVRPRSSDGQILTGFLSLIVGALSLALVLTGYLSGNDIVPLLVVSGSGLLVASVWYARTSLFRYSVFFGAYGGFFTTYALIQLGITNRWYEIPIEDLTHVVATYVSIWFVLFLITAWAVRFMSMTLSGILLATDIGIALLLGANLLGSLTLLQWASLPIFLVAALSIGCLSPLLRDRRKAADAILHDRRASGSGPLGSRAVAPDADSD